MTSFARKTGVGCSVPLAGAWLLTAGLISVGALEAQAQIVPEERPEVAGGAPAVDPADQAPVTPGGAFARSLLVPGWGHVAVGAPTRGAFYVAAQTATAWMLWKSASRRSSALRYRSLELRAVEDEIRRSGVVDPDSVRFLAEESARVERWDELADRRGEQVEDWAALGIFLVLLSATDAFVSAHLADFPEPLSLEVIPGGPGAGWEIRVRFPFPLPFPVRRTR
jgi:hypothetical protein